MYTAYYRVWYRHSGEEEIDRFPDLRYNDYRRVKDVREITTNIGNNYITHMSMQINILPALSTVAPQLTHLQARLISDSSQLERYVDESNNCTRDTVISLYSTVII